MRGKYKRISSEHIYKGKHMQVFRDEILFPDGTPGVYEHYKKNDIVVIVPVFGKKYLLIEQYRYLADSRMIEFPMGLLHKGETVEEAGSRELQEETGYISNEVKYLGKCMLNKGATSQICHFVQVNILTKGEVDYDSSESDIDELFVDEGKVKEMIHDGKIIDGPTLIGFMLSTLV